MCCQRNDIAMAITKYDQFDFLIDIVPREEIRPTKRPVCFAFGKKLLFWRGMDKIFSIAVYGRVIGKKYFSSIYNWRGLERNI